MKYKPNKPLSRRQIIIAGGVISSYIALPRLTFAAASEYQETKVVEGGEVQGQVLFTGAAPKPDRVLISKDNAHCGDGHVIPDPVVVRPDSSVFRAIVAIKEIAAGKAWPLALDTPQIVQEKCKFAPYIQFARKQAELTIINKDPLLHNIHTYELIGRARRSLFNVAQPGAGQIEKQPLKLRRSNLVEVDCDAHNWMSAWIYLSDHPYVAISDEQGKFSLEDIPPGDYRLESWHPVLGKGEQDVTIGANAQHSQNIELKT